MQNVVDLLHARHAGNLVDIRRFCLEVRRFEQGRRSSQGTQQRLPLYVFGSKFGLTMPMVVLLVAEATEDSLECRIVAKMRHLRLVLTCFGVVGIIPREAHCRGQCGKPLRLPLVVAIDRGKALALNRCIDGLVVAIGAVEVFLRPGVHRQLPGRESLVGPIVTHRIRERTELVHCGDGQTFRVLIAPLVSF